MYTQLLCHQWLEGSIPPDDQSIARLLGCGLDEWLKTKDEVLQFFPLTKGGRRRKNDRLEQESQKQQMQHERLSRAGKKGMESRWNGRDDKDIDNHVIKDKLLPGYNPSESESESESETDKKEPPPLPPTSEVGGSIASTMAQDAEVERRFIRYDTDPIADDAEKKTTREVLNWLSNGRHIKTTCKPMPPRQRIAILDAFAIHPTGVVHLACERFKREGHMENGKDYAYLVGICQRSATSAYIERTNEMLKEQRNELEQERERKKRNATLGAEYTKA